MKLRVVAAGRVKKPVRRLCLTPSALVVFTGDAHHVFDAVTGDERGTLPKGALVDDARAGQAILSRDGSTKGGRYEWRIEVWDLASVERARSLYTCNPEDKLLAPRFVGDEIFALHTAGPAANAKHFIARFAPKVSLIPLDADVMPFHLAVTADASRAAWVYFTAKGGVVDLASGVARPLVGGTLRIGRAHDKGVTQLSFAGSGAHLVAASHGASTTTVWDVATRKTVPGPWSGAQSAMFVGDVLVWRGGDPDLCAARVAKAASAVSLGRAARYAALDGGRVVRTHDKQLAIVDVVEGRELATTNVDEVTALDSGSARVAIGHGSGHFAILALD